MISVLGFAIPAGLVLVGAKYVPMLLNDLRDKINGAKDEKNK